MEGQNVSIPPPMQLITGNTFLGHPLSTPLIYKYEIRDFQTKFTWYPTYFEAVGLAVAGPEDPLTIVLPEEPCGHVSLVTRGLPSAWSTET